MICRTPVAAVPRQVQPLCNFAHHVLVDGSTILTPRGALTISRATPEDAAGIVRLRDDRAGWLVGRGIDQWRPGDLSLVWMQLCISAGWVYRITQQEQLVGSVTIVWQDPLIWGRREDRAGYIHMLVIDREFAGLGIGRIVLARSEEFIRESGRVLARLDCVRANDALRRYYEAAGYGLAGYRDFPEIDLAAETALYEKVLGTSDPNA